MDDIEVMNKQIALLERICELNDLVAILKKCAEDWAYVHERDTALVREAANTFIGIIENGCDPTVFLDALDSLSNLGLSLGGRISPS